MADSPEPDAGGTTPTAEPSEPTGADPSPGRRGRTLDGRTLAIAAVLGVAAALLTVLIASVVIDDGGSTNAMVLQDPIDADALLSQPLDRVGGGTTDLASFQEGQPMLVNLWQSACAPCVHEMPLLNDAQTANPDVTFVGVATQEPSLKDAKALAKQTGITYPWVLDPMGGVFYEAGGQGMPTTLLISKSGSVIDTKSGPFTSAGQLQAFLDQAG